MEELITKDEYKQWLEEPVTIKLLQYLDDHREKLKEVYFATVPSASTLDMMNQFRGQMFQLEVILDPEFYEVINTSGGDESEQEDAIRD